MLQAYHAVVAPDSRRLASALFAAVKSNDVSTLADVYRESPFDLNDKLFLTVGFGKYQVPDRRGSATLLHVAAAEGGTDVVKWLLARGVEMAPLDAHGNTPIDVASDTNVRLLLSRAALAQPGRSSASSTLSVLSTSRVPPVSPTRASERAGADPPALRITVPSEPAATASGSAGGTLSQAVTDLDLEALGYGINAETAADDSEVKYTFAKVPGATRLSVLERCKLLEKRERVLEHRSHELTQMQRQVASLRLFLDNPDQEALEALHARDSAAIREQAVKKSTSDELELTVVKSLSSAPGNTPEGESVVASPAGTIRAQRESITPHVGAGVLSARRLLSPAAVPTEAVGVQSSLPSSATDAESSFGDQDLARAPQPAVCVPGECSDADADTLPQLMLYEGVGGTQRPAVHGFGSSGHVTGSEFGNAVAGTATAASSWAGGVSICVRPGVLSLVSDLVDAQLMDISSQELARVGPKLKEQLAWLCGRVDRDATSGSSVLTAHTLGLEQARAQLQAYEAEVKGVEAVRIANIAEQARINDTIKEQIAKLGRSVELSFSEGHQSSDSMPSPVKGEGSQHSLSSLHDSQLQDETRVEQADALPDVEELLTLLSQKDELLAMLTARRSKMR